MIPRTTPRRGACAPKLDGKAAHRRPAAVALAAGLAALALLVAVATIAAGAAGVSTGASPLPAASPSGTPVWELSSYRSVGFDKTFKADLIEALPSPPELVVFGGSRAMRFEPSYLTGLTGLSAFNCATQCFRPEDAWAFSSYLFARSPGTRLRCVIALQARTFRDDRLRAGLLYDARLANAFPRDLVAREKAVPAPAEAKEVLGENRYSPRGSLLRNRYDAGRERANYAFERQIDVSIRRLLPNHSWTGPESDARSRAYFEKTVRLYNGHGVTPLVILMPIQPRALRAFRQAGYQRHLDRLIAYLQEARSRCDFRVLDFTDVASFGGSPTGFYDAVHPTSVNARRIVARAVRLAPKCFE